MKTRLYSFFIALTLVCLLGSTAEAMLSQEITALMKAVLAKNTDIAAIKAALSACANANNGAGNFCSVIKKADSATNTPPKHFIQLALEKENAAITKAFLDYKTALGKPLLRILAETYIKGDAQLEEELKKAYLVCFVCLLQHCANLDEQYERETLIEYLQRKINEEYEQEKIERAQALLDLCKPSHPRYYGAAGCALGATAIAGVYAFYVYKKSHKKKDSEELHELITMNIEPNEAEEELLVIKK